MSTYLQYYYFEVISHTFSKNLIYKKFKFVKHVFIKLFFKPSIHTHALVRYIDAVMIFSGTKRNKLIFQMFFHLVKNGSMKCECLVLYELLKKIIIM